MPFILDNSDLPGQIKDFCGNLQANHLLCDGASYLKTDYPNLNTKLLQAGYPYGSDATHFNVPDIRRRVLMGSGGTAIFSPSTNVGSTGGEEGHQVSVSEMPSHHHFSPNTYRSNDTSNNSYPGGLANGFQPVSYQTSDTGGSLPHNTIQPSLVVTKMIRF